MSGPVAGRSARSRTRFLLRCGAVAGPVFVASFLVQGAVRAGYDPRRHPISTLAIGPHGWVQRLSFYTSGALHLAGAVGLRRAGGHGVPASTWGPWLLDSVGAGLVGAGAFVTGPVSGYPPGSETAGAAGTAGPTTTAPSTSARLHDLCSAPVFLSLPAAAFVFARAFARTGHRGWAIGLVAAALVQLSTFVVSGAGFAQRPGQVATAGAFQRVSVASGFAWVTAVCVRALRSG